MDLGIGLGMPGTTNGPAFHYLWRESGFVGPNLNYPGAANCLIGFRIKVMGTAFRLHFRRQDETHYWMFEVSSGGSVVTLYEANGEAPVSVDAFMYPAVPDANILVYLYGSTVKWYCNGRLIYTKADAANFATATTVRVTDLTGGADLQDLFILEAKPGMQGPLATNVASLSRYPGLVIFDGDSRLASPVPWMTMFEAAITPANYGWKVAAVGGSGFAQILGRIAASFAETIYKAPPVVVFLAGVNNAGDTPAANYASIADYCGQVRALGYKVVLCTEIDAQDASRNTYNWHTQYPSLNTLIRANAATICDALVDLGADARFQNALDATYYNADKVHQSAAGQQAMADLIAVKLSALLGVNLFRNPGFDVDEVWSKNPGWTISGGAAHSAGQYDAIAQLSASMGLVNGQSYKMTFTISEYISGALYPRIGTTFLTPRSAVGTYTESGVFNGDSTTGFYSDLFVGSIDNISLTTNP